MLRVEGGRHQTDVAAINIIGGFFGNQIKGALSLICVDREQQVLLRACNGEVPALSSVFVDEHIRCYAVSEGVAEGICLGRHKQALIINHADNQVEEAAGAPHVIIWGEFEGVSAIFKNMVRGSLFNYIEFVIVRDPHLEVVETRLGIKLNRERGCLAIFCDIGDPVLEDVDRVAFPSELGPFLVFKAQSGCVVTSEVVIALLNTFNLDEELVAYLEVPVVDDAGVGASLDTECEVLSSIVLLK